VELLGIAKPFSSTPSVFPYLSEFVPSQRTISVFSPPFPLLRRGWIFFEPWLSLEGVLFRDSALVDLGNSGPHSYLAGFSSLFPCLCPLPHRPSFYWVISRCLPRIFFSFPAFSRASFFFPCVCDALSRFLRRPALNFSPSHRAKQLHFFLFPFYVPFFPSRLTQVLVNASRRKIGKLCLLVLFPRFLWAIDVYSISISIGSRSYRTPPDPPPLISSGFFLRVTSPLIQMDPAPFPPFAIFFCGPSFLA